MQRADLLKKLRTLADHPATPEHERAAARQRIEEIEAASRRPEPPPRPAPVRGKARLGVMRARPKVDRSIPETWPFGWAGPRVPMEYEAVRIPAGGIVMGWKCPGCGEQVERILDARAIMRLSAPGHDRLIEHLRYLSGGTVNQLCRTCWNRWEAA